MKKKPKNIRFQHVWNIDDRDVVTMLLWLRLDDLSPELADYLRPYGFNSFQLKCERIDAYKRKMVLGGTKTARRR